MKTIKRIQLAAAIAAAVALTGCGSDDDTTTTIVETEIPRSIIVDCSDASIENRTIDIAANVTANSTSVSEELSTALNTAKTCDTIVLPEGNHAINSSLNFNGLGSVSQEGSMVTNLTIKGAGMPETTAEASTANSGKTSLDFTGTAGDGFLISDTKNITLEDFGVFEAANNAIKLKDTDGIVIRSVSTVWETDYQATNGAYGLYPVETSNVLIEDCYVVGSADAGIYVGQTDNIVVRNNIAKKNVAGIEIENSTNADVYGNVAEGNTGGILVFDLPIGNGLYGSGVRVFGNTVTANNATNFANIGGTAGVHIVPPGTGVIILSTSDVEIFENTITDHKTVSIAVTSFMMPDPSIAAAPNQDFFGSSNTIDTSDMTADEIKNDAAVQAELANDVNSYSDIISEASAMMDGWSPLIRGINIHDNTISVQAGINAPEGKLIQDIIDGFGQVQHVVGMIDLTVGDKPQLPQILYDGVGELLSNSILDPNKPDESILQTIMTGVNTVAAIFYALAEPIIPNLELAQIPDLTIFAKYTDTAADRVCQADNGSATASAVFETVQSANNISSTTGEPFTKLELFGAEAAKGAGADPVVLGAIAGSLLMDDEMTCTGFDAYVGTKAVVTVNGAAFGCATDDTTSTHCVAAQ